MGVSHKRKISVQSSCNTSTCARPSSGPRVQPQGTHGSTALTCRPVSTINLQSLFSPSIIVWFTQHQVLPSNGVRPQGMTTLTPNAPEHLMQSASHGHSAPKRSVLTSSSTSQGHSSDQSKAQVASKNVHTPACRSAQGVSNTKPASSSQKNPNQQAKFSASESTSFLPHRDRQHPISFKQEAIRKGMHICITVFMLIKCSCELLSYNKFFVS